VGGYYIDNDGDDLVSWVPDPDMPNEKPTGYDPKKVESAADDPVPAIGSDGTQSGDIVFNSGKPYASVSSLGEATAEFNEAFTTMFGNAAPKDLISGFAAELRNLQASRSNKPITGKSVDIVIQGVSPQERQDILNKYLKNYATKQIELAGIGDAKAIANLQKGNFGVAMTTIKNAYSENGLPFNSKSLSQIALESALNPNKLKSNLNLINLQAKTYFPALADKIDSGYTVKQLLSPYIQTRANILEEDPDLVDVASLKSVASDSKNLMSLYEYEISLRKDPKWRFTKNAQDSLSNVASSIAKTFGLVG
jgi:hypothetical protein